jgi:GNAT superfamily N-acetyltransferase
VHIQDLSLSDLPDIDDLREAIGWGAGRWFLEPMVSNGGCVPGIRTVDGELLAMGGTAVFEPFGFICNMVVKPGLKRQGMGRRLFEHLLAWLRQRGLESIQLEATDEGKPLYEQYGFATRWESVSASMQAPVQRGDESGIAPVLDTDWPAIAALDRVAYGGDRSAFLRLLAAGPHREDGLVLTANGRLEAFGFRYPGRIGPLVAANEPAAERLARALAARAPVGTYATVGHPMHTVFWERLGFEVHPFDVRMSVGPAVRDEPGMVYSMLNGGVG